MTPTNPTDTYIDEFERHLNGLYLHDGEHTIAGAIQLLKSTLQKHRTEVLDEAVGAFDHWRDTLKVVPKPNDAFHQIRRLITNLKEKWI